MRTAVEAGTGERKGRITEVRRVIPRVRHGVDNGLAGMISRARVTKTVLTVRVHQRHTTLPVGAAAIRLLQAVVVVADAATQFQEVGVLGVGAQLRTHPLPAIGEQPVLFRIGIEVAVVDHSVVGHDANVIDKPTALNRRCIREVGEAQHDALTGIGAQIKLVFDKAMLG